MPVMKMEVGQDSTDWGIALSHIAVLKVYIDLNNPLCVSYTVRETPLFQIVLGLKKC